MSQNPLKSTQFQNRIKKIMQTDEDVGKVAAGATFMMSCAIDAFLDTLLGGAAEVATSRNARTLTASHLKSTIHASPLLDFCKEAVATVPDLPPPGSEPASGPKRSRAGASGSGSAPKKPRGSGGGGRGRGRGRGAGAAAAAAAAPGDEAAAAAAAAMAAQEALAAAPAEAAEELVVQPALDASFLDAAPGKEAEEEDYDDM